MRPSQTGMHGFRMYFFKKTLLYSSFLRACSMLHP